MDWTNKLKGLNAQQSYSKLHDIYERTCTQNIPKVREGVKKKSERWVNREVKDAVKLKHRSWYQLKKGESKTEYRRVCKDLKKTVKKARNEFEKSIAVQSKKEPKLVHAYVRSKMTVKDSVNALKNDDGDLTTNKEEIAKILNDHFRSIFVKESNSNPPSFVKRTDLSLSVKDILKKIDSNKVEEKLKKLKDSKAPGADGIHPLILKTCAESIAKPLKIIFEKSLKEGKLPEW
jgi:hypothetical protein